MFTFSDGWNFSTFLPSWRNVPDACIVVPLVSMSDFLLDSEKRPFSSQGTLSIPYVWTLKGPDPTEPAAIEMGTFCFRLPSSPLTTCWLYDVGFAASAIKYLLLSLSGLAPAWWGAAGPVGRTAYDPGRLIPSDLFKLYITVFSFIWQFRDDAIRTINGCYNCYYFR